MDRTVHNYSYDEQCSNIKNQILFLHGRIKRKQKTAILLVEGYTDFVFYKEKVQEYVELVNMQHIIDEINTVEQARKISNCAAIEYIISLVYGSEGLSRIIKPDVFGVVDLDYEDENAKRSSIQNLFITDTHDLETLLISTDNEVLDRLDIELTPSQLEDAKLLSYELADIRQKIYQNTDLIHSKINEDNGTVDFSKLVEGAELSLKKVLNRIDSQREYPLDDKAFKRLLNTLKECSGNKVSGNGVYTLKNNELTKLLIQGVWQKVNGHDFCSAIMFVNENAYNKYKKGWEEKSSKDNNFDSKCKRINRDMELDIIVHYNNSCFTRTELYKKLYDAVLIRKISKSKTN